MDDTPNKGNGASPTTVNSPGDTEMYTFVGADNSVISGLMISHTAINGGRYGVYVVNVSMEISENTFSFGYGGVFCDGSGDIIVRENDFENSSYGVYLDFCTGAVMIQDNTISGNTGIPMNISSATSSAVISGNIITGNGMIGIQIQNGAPQITGNTFNNAGGYTYGAVSITNSSPTIRNNTFQCDLAVLVRNFGGTPIPDIGTALENGNNNFTAVTGYSIHIESGFINTIDIYAIGNSYPNSPPIADVDIYNPSSPTVKVCMEQEGMITFNYFVRNKAFIFSVQSTDKLTLD